MKPGDLVRNKNSESGELGLFIGYKTSGIYKFAEVMWFTRRSPSGDIISSIQRDLIEVVK